MELNEFEDVPEIAKVGALVVEVLKVKVRTARTPPCELLLRYAPQDMSCEFAVFASTSLEDQSHQLKLPIPLLCKFCLMTINSSQEGKYQSS
jgi:hypothetical protein